MKKPYLLIIFVLINIFFIFFHIYKESKIVQLSYQNQKYKKQKAKLVEQKTKLQQELQKLQDLKAIKTFATDNLKMQKLNVNQVKKLDEIATNGQTK